MQRHGCKPYFLCAELPLIDGRAVCIPFIIDIRVTLISCLASSARGIPRVLLIHQPNNALNKIQFMTSVNLVHVSAPGWHP